MRKNQDSFLEKQTQIYLFSYEHDNAHWSVEIPAYTREDAEIRIKKLSTAQYNGELQLKIDMPTNN